MHAMFAKYKYMIYGTASLYDVLLRSTFMADLWYALFVLRSWRSDVESGAIALVSFSVEHPSVKPTSGTIRGQTLTSSFLIESRGPMRCQLTYISRADLR